MKIFLMVFFIFLFPKKSNSSEQFSDIFHKELIEPTIWSAESKDKINSFQFTYIGSMESAFQPWGMFEDSIQEMKNQGLDNYSIIKTSYFSSARYNAVKLANIILNLYKKVEKPIILIGHPSSGPDALMLTLLYPQLVTSGIINSVVLIQPAFGSPLIPLENNKFNKNYVMADFSEAISSLNQENFKILNKRIYYIRGSEKKLSKVNIALIPTWVELKKNQKETDGITYTEEQMLKTIGQDLGVLPADHWDLFVSNRHFSTSTNNKFRNAFTRALIGKLITE